MTHLSATDTISRMISPSYNGMPNYINCSSSGLPTDLAGTITINEEGSVFLPAHYTRNNKATPKKVIPNVARVIYNPPATIVFWDDDTKTVVKCSPDTKFDAYSGFCAAVAKKAFDTNSAIRRAAGLPKGKGDKEEKQEVNV